MSGWNFPPASVTGFSTVFAPPSDPDLFFPHSIPGPSQKRQIARFRTFPSDHTVSGKMYAAKRLVSQGGYALFTDSFCPTFVVTLFMPASLRGGMKLSAFSAARAFICLRKASVRQHGLPQFPYGKLLFASLCLKFPQLALQAQFPSSALINCWAVRPDTPPCRSSNWSARRSSSSSASAMPWRSASASTIS